MYIYFLPGAPFIPGEWLNCLCLILKSVESI
jgi:hypothetical protein